MGIIYDQGQKVTIRGQNWEIVETTEKNNVQTLKVIGIDDENLGKTKVFLAPVENITSLHPTDLKWHIGTPTEWNNFHNAFLLTMKHGRNPLLSLNAGRVIIEDYQLEPVVHALTLDKQRLLLADDVGLGKTIEAGLIMMELLARGRANRVLIITPASLQDQWTDEMKYKFGLEFHIFDTPYIKNLTADLPRGANPWTHYSRIITSMDFVKRGEIRRRGFDNAQWDLVIIDEAHHLCKSGSGENLRSTDRSRLGEFISKKCDSLILLTATPHNGYSESYFSLLQLLDPYLKIQNMTEAIDRMKKNVVRRAKSKILNPDGTPKFQEPISITQSIDLQDEREFYEQVCEYCDNVYNSAQNTKGKEAIGFAMTILKKRLLSSIYAFENTLSKRIENLTEEPIDLDKKTGLIRDYISGANLTESQIEYVEKLLTGGSLYDDLANIDEEKKFLVTIQTKLEEIRLKGDIKIQKLLEILNNFYETYPDEKVIIFTEYRDTQNYINEYLSANGYQDQIILMHGSLNRNERIQAERDFASPKIKIMIATDAASEGLNFQKWCHTIIHNEFPWNPNRLVQRNGRVARWGQKFQVQVINLFLKDSYESEILEKIQEKIETISKDVGSVTDVIGIMSDLNIQDFLMKIRPKDHLKPDELADNALQISRKIDEELDVKTQNFLNWRKESLLESSGFGFDNYQKVETQKNETDYLIPTFDDIKQFLFDAFKLERGEIKEVGPSIFQLRVPQIYCGADVESFYPRATFDRQIAIDLSYSENQIEFFTPYHPLVKSVLRIMRKKIYDPNFKGRVSYKVMENISDPGILFTYHVRFQDKAGNVLEESLFPIFIDLNGNCEFDLKKNFEIMRQKGEPINVSKEKLTETFKDLLSSLQENTKTALFSQFIPEKIKSFIEEAGKKAEIKKKDIESWLKGEETFIREEITQIKHEIKKGKVRDTTLLEFVSEPKDKLEEESETLLNRRIQYKKGELEKIKLKVSEQIKQLENYLEIAASKETLLGALFIIPMNFINNEG